MTHLPSGTVKLETLIARDIVAKVIARNISSSNEETPGIARVFDTINVMGMPEVDLGADPSKGIISGLSPDGVLSSVQLWQRCMPDDLTLRVGDDVQIDVAYYRPDKLFFARNVRISKFRRIAREFGNICSLKEHGFGFIHSSIRSSDLYFKTSQVIGLNGLPEQEANLSVDMMVSYDVVIEETNNGYKLRAYRIKVEDPVAIEMENNSKFLLKKDVIGYIAKISTKKDVAGVIKIFPQFVESVQSLEYQEPEIVEALTEFKAMDELSQINLYGLPNALLLTYYTIIEEMFSGSLVHETAPIDKNDPNMGKTLKILKVTPEEYEFWRSTNKKLRSNADGKKRDDKADDVEGSVPVKILRQVKNRKDTIQYFKEEYISEEFGPLANDLKVMFDICWDKNRLKKVAKSVRQTEELIPDCPGIQYGVIEVALEKGAKFGFIRTIPTDEKLFWHVSSAGAIAVKNLHLGSEVSFEMRRRGGLRSAVNIQSLPTGALRKEEILEGLCSAIVMENNLLFLLDPLAIREFVGKYLDLKVLVIVLQCMTMKPSKPTRSDEAWDRASILKDNAELLAEESSAGSALTDGSQQGFTLDATVNEGTHFLNESPPVNEQIESSGNAKAKCAIDGIALGLTDSDEKLHHDSDGDGTKEFNIEYKPKFFPLLYRSPVGIDPAFTAVAENDGETKPESGGSYKAQVGDYILCSLLVDWSLQRSPIRAVNLNVVDNNDEGVNRRKGRINRIKFRLKPSIIENSKELLQSYNSNCVWDEDKSLATITTMDMVEIMLVEEKTKEQRLQELANFQENADKDKLLYYYCDFREINVLDENARDFPQVGDTVEFWSMKTYGPLALGVTLLPKPKDLVSTS